MEGPSIRRVRCRARCRSADANARGHWRAVHRTGAAGRRQGGRGRLARARLLRDQPMTAARSIRVRGVVQGVGFRPFVYRLARANGLAGWVSNEASGVAIHLEGDEPGVEAFLRDLAGEPPPAAVITAIDISDAAPAGLKSFTIRPTQDEAPPTVRISPDLSVCEDCLREMRDPADPRYRYEYINCTNCGPRYSVIER